MSWKIFYLNQKAQNQMLRNRVREQRREIAHYRDEAENYYNAYMDVLDEAVRMRGAVTTAICQNCGEQSAMLGRYKTVRYCPRCGNYMFAAYRQKTIAEGR